MPNWKKLIVSGSDANLNSLDVLASITGSTFLVNDIISIADGTAAAPSLRFTDDPDTGIYRSTDNTFNVTVGGTNMFAINSSGITSGGNVYSGTTGQFRNFAGVWKATTGTTGNGFNFSSADLSDLLTISSTGDSVFKGDITINNTSSGNQLTIQSPVPDIQFIDSQATSRKARISAENGNLLFEADTDSGESNTGILFKMDGANALSFITNKNAYFAADISGSDVYINDWNSVSASLSTLTQNQTLNSGGTVDYVARFESANTITTGVIRDDGSTVGINAAPSANKTLYIDGTIQATGEAFFSHVDIIGSGGNSRIRDDIQFKFGTNRIFGIQYNSSGDYLEFTSGSNNLVTLLGNGNVGIGTTSPDRNLHVKASAIVSTKLEGTNAGHLLDLVNSNASPTYNGIRFTQGTTSKMAVTHIADGTTKGYVQIGNSWGAGSEILVVDGRTSRVGIGTTSPTAELQVAGDVIVDGTITAQEFHTEFVSASIIYESGSTKFGDTSEDIHSFSGSLRVTGSGDHYFTDGNVGIGTTTPIRTFHVEEATTYPGRFSYNSTNYLDIGYDSLNVKGGSLLFRNDGTEHLRIDTTGALKAALYGSGNFTGTLAYSLGVDSSGNVIEFTGGSGGSVSSITNGADNRLAIFTGADSLEGDPNLTFDGTNFYVNGNIGIGTATPGEALEVVGNVEAEEFIGDLRGAVLFKAQAGEALSKGDVVYISGISGNTTVVSKADADDANKMPAFGIAATAASLNNPVDIYTVGTLKGIDTSGFTIGDELYVSSSAGELTATAPTGESSLIQKIAKVTRVDNAAGSIKISGAGRTNATPNLNEGRLFVGNASNQAVADGTIHVDIANTRVGIGTNNPAVTLHVDGWTRVNGGLQLDGNNRQVFAIDDTNLLLGTNNTERIRITSTGNVGIGTSNVSRINSTSTFFQPDENGRFLVMNHNSGSFIMLETNATGDGDQVGGIYFNKTGNQSDAHTHVAGIDAVLVDHATDALDGGELRFFTKVAGAGDTSHHMLLDAGGNFGIGQGIDPAAKLHVDAGSSDEVARFVSTDNKAYIRISDDDTTGYVSSENGLFSLGRNAGVNAANINIDASNNVGIGTSNPGAKLDVHGRVDFANDLRLRGTDSAADQGVVRFYVNSNNELTIDSANNGNNLFVIDEGGQVGINTSSPSRTLDVNGEIQNNGIFRKGGNVIIKSTGSETMFGPGGSGIITFHNSATMTTGDETIRIDADGNLLLNNTSAGARLDIREDTNYAIRAEDASGHYFRVNTGGDVEMRGDLTVQGIITAQEFHTEFVSASIIYESGSTKFGDTSDDVHNFTGSVNVKSLSTGVRLNLEDDTAKTELQHNLHAFRIKVDPDNADSNSNFRVEIDGSEKFRIDNDGDVSIGTTSPSTVGGIAKMTVNVGSGAASPISIVNGTTDGMYIRRYSTGGSYQLQTTLGNANSGNLSLQSYGGNVGIGTTSPTHKLTVTGDIDADDITIDDWGSVSASLSSIQQAGGVNGTGASNKLAIWSDSDTLTSDTNLHWDTTNDRLGIGTATPAQKLHIQGSALLISGSGTAAVRAYPTSNTYEAQLKFTSNEMQYVWGGGVKAYFNPSNQLSFGDRDPSNAGAGAAIRDPKIGKFGSDVTGSFGIKTADIFRVYVSGSGEVGVGTTTPSEEFEVVGDAKVTNLGINAGAQDYLSSLSARLAVGGNVVLNENNPLIYLRSNSTGNDSDIRYQTALKFTNGAGSTHAYINSSGNVGIGTDNPGASLHVASTTNDYVAKFSHTTATGYAPGSILLQAGQHASRGQGLFHYNTEADDSWFTGVPYNVNSTKWIVAHKPDTTFNPDVAQLSHAIFTIDSATDNVGIGISAPQTKLHVAGPNSDGSAATIRVGGPAVGTGNNVSKLELVENTTNSNADMSYGFSFTADGNSSNNLLIKRHSNSTSGATVLTIERDASNATFHNNLTALGSLTVGDSNADSAQIGLKHLLGYCENTDVDTGTETVKELALSVYQAVFFDYVVKNGTNLRAGTVTAVHDGTNVEYTDTSTKDLGDTSAVTLSVDISGSNMRLRATTTSDNWIVKANIRGIKV